MWFIYVQWYLPFTSIYFFSNCEINCSQTTYSLLLHTHSQSHISYTHITLKHALTHPVTITHYTPIHTCSRIHYKLIGHTSAHIHSLTHTHSHTLTHTTADATNKHLKQDVIRNQSNLPEFDFSSVFHRMNAFTSLWWTARSCWPVVVAQLANGRFRE